MGACSGDIVVLDAEDVKIREMRKLVDIVQGMDVMGYLQQHDLDPAQYKLMNHTRIVSTRDRYSGDTFSDEPSDRYMLSLDNLARPPKALFFYEKSIVPSGLFGIIPERVKETAQVLVYAGGPTTGC